MNMDIYIQTSTSNRSKNTYIFAIIISRKSYMEKQLFLLLVTVNLTRGASLERWLLPTASHLLGADGLGRFSGTIVSNELRCHGGHVLISLHLALDSATTGVIAFVSFAIALPSPSPVGITTPPITMHAAAIPATHCFLHFSSLRCLHDNNITYN